MAFPIQHIAATTGVKNINQALSYTDTQGNVVSFSNPSVFVNCESTFCADHCPIPVDVSATGCSDFVHFDAGDLSLEDAGRILQLDVNLLNVCPGRRIALAVVLTELDPSGSPQPRGMKTFTIPAHNSPTCVDVRVTCIRFILPENGTGLCAERNLQAKFMAHYIDNDFSCCSCAITMA